MAGTVTLDEHKSKAVKRVKWSWTSDGSGNADQQTANPYYGEVIEVITDPGATAPTDDYDLTITDDTGRDILQGAGANRDTANTERCAPAAASAVFGKLTLNISNAGNAKQGVVYLYIR